MPRVADIYQRPPGIDAVTNATIDSADYNLNVADVETDLNLPRPIVAGGTGATSATAARDNLDAEVALAVVTNYNSHVWEAGSFKSAVGATGAPTPTENFSGICHLFDPTSCFLEARAYEGTNKRYFRRKYANTWYPWIDMSTEFTDAFVNVTGDTMTGTLTMQGAGILINGSSPALVMDVQASDQQRQILGSINGTSRWVIAPGDNVHEGGGNSGSNFSINRFSDGGTYLGSPFTINRATGAAAMSGPLVVTSKGSVFGGPAGAVTAADANIKLYEASAVNWCGMGCDLNGDYWLRTGLSGAPLPALKINTSQTVTVPSRLFVGPTAPTNAGIIGVKYTSSAGYAGQIFQPDSTGSTYAIVFENSGGAIIGTITTSDSATAYNTASDASLKEDLKSFDAGAIIDATMVYNFKWKSSEERAYGMLAQQAVEVYPTAVTHTLAQTGKGVERDEWWGIDYSKYVPVILQELKTLRARVAELEGKVGAGVQPA